MRSIRDILAHNLRENRKKCRFSQRQLAEKAGISTQFVAMIELSRQFPSPEILDKIAGALDIETYELFAVYPSIRDEIVEEIRQTVADTLEKALLPADG